MTRSMGFLWALDLVQDLYIKELKAYKAPPPVRDLILYIPCPIMHLLSFPLLLPHLAFAIIRQLYHPEPSL